MLEQTHHQTPWLGGLGLSIILHSASLVLLTHWVNRPVKPRFDPIKVKVVEVKPEVPAAPTVVEPPPPVPPPKPPIPKKPIVPTNKIPPKSPAKPVEAIQGFKKDTLAPATGPGIAVPIGNTVMAPDTGKRVNEAPPITGDQSQDARLIPNSYNEPQYTDAALDASLEGRFIVDVYVDEQGNVIEAELRKKIGYGMDQKIIEAIKTARFVPRKNQLGIAESSWTNITISLRLP